MIKKLRRFFAALGVLATLVVPVLLFLRRRPPGNTEVTDNARETLEQVRKAVTEAVQAQGDRKERAEAAKEKLQKIMSGALVLVLCFIAAFPAMATGQVVYMPESYDELIEYYLAAVEVAQEYRALYEEAEVEVARLLGQIETLDDEVERLTGYIERYCWPAWGLTGGVISTRDDIQWTLGVSRRKGRWSFGGGIGSGNKFNVWASTTLWLTNPL